MRRFDMRLPATVKVAGKDILEMLTETQNVSARGMFLYLDREIAPGSQLDITITLPPHVTLSDCVRVRFRALVVRLDNRVSASRVGIAAAILDYQFLRSHSQPAFLENLGKWRD